MKTDVIIEHWEWPIFKAEPRGFDYIEVVINEPSQSVCFKATIPLKGARVFGDRLKKLAETLGVSNDSK